MCTTVLRAQPPTDRCSARAAEPFRSRTEPVRPIELATADQQRARVGRVDDPEYLVARPAAAEEAAVRRDRTVVAEGRRAEADIEACRIRRPVTHAAPAKPNRLRSPFGS